MALFTDLSVCCPGHSGARTLEGLTGSPGLRGALPRRDASSLSSFLSSCVCTTGVGRLSKCFGSLGASTLYQITYSVVDFVCWVV